MLPPEVTSAGVPRRTASIHAATTMLPIAPRWRWDGRVAPPPRYTPGERTRHGRSRRVVHDPARGALRSAHPPVRPRTSRGRDVNARQEWFQVGSVAGRGRCPDPDGDRPPLVGASQGGEEMNTKSTIVWGVVADGSGIVQNDTDRVETLPGGGVRVERRSLLAHEPASDYARTHPAPMPMRWQHGVEIGRIVALRRAQATCMPWGRPTSSPKSCRRSPASAG